MPKEATPKLSIIIPAYNEQEVIEQTIKAIQGANLSELCEILVVCNGCTDDTEEIAKNCGAKILLAPEKGAAKAMNYGAKHAEGEILAFLDADTIVASNLFEELFRGSDKGAIGGRTVVKWEGKGIMPKLFSLVSYLHRYKWGGFCFVNKSTFESIGGYKVGAYGFDFDLGQRVTKEGKVAFLWKSHVTTSARRFEEEGWLKHIFLAAKRYYLDHEVLGKGVKAGDEIEYDDIRKN